jgi:hypothetical protein
MSVEEPTEDTASLKAEIARLKSEIAFLKSHSTLVRGMQGETLVCNVLGGEFTDKLAGCDLIVGSSVRVEVKSSSIRTPNGNSSSSRRWQWSKPLGENNYGKNYDLLVLLGDNGKL